MKKLTTITLSLILAIPVSSQVFSVQLMKYRTGSENATFPAHVMFKWNSHPQETIENGDLGEINPFVSFGMELGVAGVFISYSGGTSQAFSYIDPATENVMYQIYKLPRTMSIGIEPRIFIWKFCIDPGIGIGFVDGTPHILYRAKLSADLAVSPVVSYGKAGAITTFSFGVQAKI